MFATHLASKANASYSIDTSLRPAYTANSELVFAVLPILEDPNGLTDFKDLRHTVKQSLDSVRNNELQERTVSGTDQ